jgi:hypothetical protein
LLIILRYRKRKRTTKSVKNLKFEHVEKKQAIKNVTMDEKKAYIADIVTNAPSVKMPMISEGRYLARVVETNSKDPCAVLMLMDLLFDSNNTDTPKRDDASDEKDSDDEEERDVIEFVPRAWEESYLRSAKYGERECYHDANCVARKLNPYLTLREYFTPNQLKEVQANQMYPTDRMECLMCLRHSIARVDTYCYITGKSVKKNIRLSHYANYVGVPGEYCIENCLAPRNDIYNGITDPIVFNSNHHYECVQDGIVKQNLPTPVIENTQLFQHAPLAHQN